MVEKRDFRQRRLSRRRMLTGAAMGGAGVAVATVLGCQKAPGPAASPTAKEPKRGGILVHGGGQAGSGEATGRPLDPHVNHSGLTPIYRLFYQGMLGYHLRTYEVEPELAQKWEQPSPTEYVFHIVPNVRWHNRPPVNGRPLTVDDFLFSYERIQTDNPQFQHRTLLAGVDKIEAVDKEKIKITTNGPHAALLMNLAADGNLILAREAVEKAGRFINDETAIGTGAFMVRKVEENVGGEYVRNPGYWKPGLPHLDGLRTVHFSDEQGGYAAFLAGQLHITRVPGSETKNYIPRQGKDYTPDWFADTCACRMMQPNTRVKPMDDARVTRALRLLIDHQEFKTGWADVWAGRGRYGSVFPPAMDHWDLTEEEYSRKIFWRQPKEEAVREGLALLGAAGFSRENPLRFEMIVGPAPQDIAAIQLLQDQWRRFGQGIIDTRIQSHDTNRQTTLQATGQFTLSVTGFGGPVNDPDSWFGLYSSASSRNYMGLTDPRIDAYWERQRRALDLRERRAIVKEAIDYMADNVPGVVLVGRYYLWAVDRRVQGGFAPQLQLSGRQYEWLWLDT